MNITVKKPNYMNSYDLVKSHNLKNINISKTDEVTETLQSMYSFDKMKCFVMAEELMLRGYEIGGLEPMIPRVSAPEKTYVIEVIDNYDLYAKINWNILGIPGFVGKFMPSSDYFYHGIVVNNFTLLEPRVNVSQLLDQFRKIGFSVIMMSKDNNISRNKRESGINKLEQIIHEKMDLVEKTRKITDKQLSEIIVMQPFYLWDDLKQLLEKEHYYFNAHSQNLKKVANLCGYRYYNRAFIKQKMSMKKAVGFIFRYFLKRNTKMDDNSYRIITTHLEKGFGISGINNKSIYNAIINNNNINCIEAGIFIYQENIEIETELKDEISCFIESAINERMAVDASEVFKKYRSKLKPYGIKNAVLLNQWIRRWFGEQFVYSKGKSLLIKSPNNKEITNETLMINLLIKKKSELSKSKIAAELKWKVNKVSQTVHQSEQLFVMEDGKISYISKATILKKDINRFYSIVISKMPLNYSFSDDLYFELLNTEDAKKMLKNLKIDSPMSLSQIIRTIFKNKFRGNANFIYRSNSAIKSVEESIIHTFPQTHRVGEVASWLKKHDYSSQMIRFTLDKLIDSFEYYQISAYEIAHKSMLPSIYQKRGIINRAISDTIGNNPYWIPKYLDELLDKLPEIELIWTKDLFAQVALKIGYGKLAFKNNTPENNPFVLLPKSSNISSMKELHVYIYKYEYKGNPHEASFYEYLYELGLYGIKDNIMKKKLKREVYGPGGLKVNDVGQLSLYEGGQID